MPGTDRDVQIADIPVVTAIDSTADMYGKPVSPAYQYLTSTCSSPDTAHSMEASCAPADRDHLYASHSPTTAVIAENKHLKGMLMAHLDIIQQQSETIMSKDKMLKALREETGLLRQKLSRMTRRLGREGGEGKRAGEARRGAEVKKGSKRAPEEQGAGERPAKRQARLPEPELGEGSVSMESEELLVELKVEPKVEESAVLPVVGTVDELRDEFCQQTSPEMRRNEARVPSPEGPPATPATGKKGRAGGEARKGRGSVGAPALLPGGAAPPPSLAAPLTTSTLYYVGCRNDRQVMLYAESGVGENEKSKENPLKQIHLSKKNCLPYYGR